MLDTFVKKICDFFSGGKISVPTTRELIVEINQRIEKLLQEIKNLPADEISNNHINKLDKLFEFRAILENSSNSDSIQQMLKTFIDHENPALHPAAGRNDNQGQALITNAAMYLYLLRNSSQSLEASKIHDPALGLELFRTYRSMIEHEGTLLNQRVNWFLVTQGFLFAAFATVLSVEISFFSLLFLLIISGTGLIYSSLVLNPISLSLLAVDTLKQEWKKRAQIQPDGLITRQVKKLLPKQVCFDAEQGITIDKSGAITADSILKNYFPRYYTYYFKKSREKFLQERTPKSRDYRGRINWIPRGTIIIWLVIFIFTVIQGHNQFFKKSFFVISDLIYPKNTTDKVKLKPDELKEIIDNQSLPLKTSICLNPVIKKEQSTQKKIDTYEEVLFVTQNKDNIPFALSKRLFKYYEEDIKKLLENNENLNKEIQTKITHKIISIIIQGESIEDEQLETIINNTKVDVQELKIRENKLKFCQE